MLISMITAGIVLGGAPTIAPTKIVSASLFKNGYAVVVREAPLDKSGQTLIEPTPASTLGTVWLTASEGTKLLEVVNTSVAGTTDTSFGSLDEILAGNVGKKVTLAIHPGDQVLGGSRTGTIVSASGSVVVLQSEKDIVAIPKSSIASMVAEGSSLQWKRSVENSTRALRIKSTGPEGSKVVIVSLERGITWSPAFSVDISDDKNLKLVAKATVLNDLGDMDGVEARFVTGFPNVPFVGTLDPMTSGASLDAFVSSIMRVGTPVMAQGFGGNGGFAMNSQRADFRNNFDEAFVPNPDATQSIEDLFFYHQPDVKLKKGDRGYFVLFSIQAPYEHVYTWAVDENQYTPSGYGSSAPGPRPSGLGDVWHCLRFKNTGKQPFTTGPAATFKNGELLGQDSMSYVSPGAETELKVTKALDIRAERNAEEVSREKGAIKRTDGNPLYDLATVKETLQVSNRKATKVKMCISRELTGEVVTADLSPKISKTTKGLRDVNINENVEWNLDIEPGKAATIVFTYKLYVPTQG